MKTCTCCKESKPLTDFSPRKNSKQGRNAQCRTCRRRKAREAPSGSKEKVCAYAKKARAKDPEKTLLQRRTSYHKHAEKRRQEKRDRYRHFTPEQREEFLARKRELRRQNPMALLRSLKKCREYYATHREEAIAYVTQWAKDHPDQVRDRANRRRAKILHASKVEVVDRQAIIARDNSRCHICKKFVNPKEMTLDHLIPLARGGNHTAVNLAVAHRRCNASHGAGRFPVQLRLLG